MAVVSVHTCDDIRKLQPECNDFSGVTSVQANSQRDTGLTAASAYGQEGNHGETLPFENWSWCSVGAM